MAEATIKTKYKILRVMPRNNVNLSNPEEVKLFIARNKNWSNRHKIIAVYAYNDYAKMLGIKWEIPYYKKNFKREASPEAEKPVCYKSDCRGLQKSSENF